MYTFLTFLQYDINRALNQVWEYVYVIASPNLCFEKFKRQPYIKERTCNIATVTWIFLWRMFIKFILKFLFIKKTILIISFILENCKAIIEIFTNSNPHPKLFLLPVSVDWALSQIRFLLQFRWSHCRNKSSLNVQFIVSVHLLFFGLCMYKAQYPTE